MINIPVIRNDFPTTMKVKYNGERDNLVKMTPGSAGYDLKSADDVTIYPGEFKLVGTGLYFELPLGTEIQIRSRSGMAKKGVLVANSPGTIDSDYRGEVCVILYNAMEDVYVVKKGDRIAQAVFNVLPIVELNYSEELNSSTRGDGGFGSTGC
jgi:dUTP pyrophosphatase